MTEKQIVEENADSLPKEVNKINLSEDSSTFDSKFMVVTPSPKDMKLILIPIIHLVIMIMMIMMMEVKMRMTQMMQRKIKKLIYYNFQQMLVSVQHFTNVKIVNQMQYQKLSTNFWLELPQ